MKAPAMLSFALAASAIPSVPAAFYLFLRSRNYCDVDCNRRPGVCYPKQVVERAVMNGYQNYPGICGSGPVDFWVTNNGQALELWKHAAKPGVKVASCYKQSSDRINCGDKVCEIVKVTNAWVCTDTKLY
ncbi:hypothetical protein GQ44DRAFT_729060 [Phaeosphaeriaceae sp. PMI808]|nr:hypothetical protein GQ44DRAFT_729060 [Phaeosphaeriaceae sp. PMI808]